MKDLYRDVYERQIRRELTILLSPHRADSATAEQKIANHEWRVVY